jgi:hypothetical protein
MLPVEAMNARLYLKVIILLLRSGLKRAEARTIESVSGKLFEPKPSGKKNGWNVPL